MKQIYAAVVALIAVLSAPAETKKPVHRRDSLSSKPDEYFRRWNCVGYSWTQAPLSFNYQRPKEDEPDLFQVFVLSDHKIQIKGSSHIVNGIYAASADDSTMTLADYPTSYKSQLGGDVYRKGDPTFDRFYGRLRIFWEASWFFGSTLKLMYAGDCKGY